jgi:hypothetical protein
MCFANETERRVIPIGGTVETNAVSFCPRGLRECTTCFARLHAC